MTAKPYKKHLSSGKDLETSYEETRAGFVAIALERNRRATPYVAEARALRSMTSGAKVPKELFSIPKIKKALVTAAGISDKAAGHIGGRGQDYAIKEFVKNFLEPAGSKFIEELVFRFLLTKGDALGGSMRNLVGLFSQKKLTTAIAASLNVSGISYFWLHNQSKKWFASDEGDVDDIECARGLSWILDNRTRTLIYNLKVPLFGNNVDMCLFNCDRETFSNNGVHERAEAYIALGELKGGIDPAGADEHWKTAKSALDRIFRAFLKQKQRPKLFFIGAAIETKMAREIWGELKRGKLANAANLTKSKQISSLCEWLVTI